MDREGLDLAVLFPSRGLFVLGLDSSEAITGSSSSTGPLPVVGAPVPSSGNMLNLGTRLIGASVGPC